MCCCTQHVHVFKTTCDRKNCCCTQHMHARNMCRCARATCLNKLHATFSRVYMYGSIYWSIKDQDVHATCVVAHDISTCSTCVVARNMCSCEVHVRMHMVHETCARVHMYGSSYGSSYEHSEQARAPHTNGPRDVPRCGALSLLQKTLPYKGG
jgi:hypothetical protein